MLHRLHEWWSGPPAVPDPAPPPADEVDLRTPPPLDLSALTEWQQDIERRVRYVEAELATVRRREGPPRGLRHR